MDEGWKSEISTPALVLNYDVLMKNIRTMAKFVKESGINLRPHLKTAKMPIIAHMILKEGGANGIAVAKVGEAEVFAQSGINDILIANQVIDKDHIKRLVMLNNYTMTRCAVDSKQNILELSHLINFFFIVSLNLSRLLILLITSPSKKLIACISKSSESISECPTFSISSVITSANFNKNNFSFINLYRN